MSEQEFKLGEYWLSKRSGSQSWQRTWYDKRAQRTGRAPLGTDDFEEAKIRLAEWYAKHGRIKKQPAKDTPLELLFVRYYTQYASTLASHETARIALAYWVDFWPNAYVKDLTIDRQEDFVKWMQEKNFSDGYIKRILSVGKAALTRAYKRQEIESIPFVITWHDAPPADKALTLEECRAIWSAAIHPHERMYLIIALNTAARPEAILDIQKAQANFDDNFLTQNPDGRKQTRKFRPVVPLTSALRAEIEKAPDGHLVNWHGNKIKSFKTAWRGIRKRARLSGDIMPKAIRHTVATELRRHGVAEAEIQGMLGHKAFSGETGRYAQYRPDYLSHAARVVNAFFLKVSRQPRANVVKK